MASDLRVTEEELLLDMEAALAGLFDDPDFDKLHRQLSPFNMFEAMGAIRAELRHSNFLAYLLSPSRPHGLNARPLVAVLRAILARLPPSERPMGILELIAGQLDDAIVYRERDNIDILIELPILKFVVAIENKIDAKAGSGQLQRYSEYLGAKFPDYRRLLVFLTPGGDDPNHKNYVAYDYADLAHTLERMVDSFSEPISEASSLIIRHYISMVRRHIVEDERLRTLALALYERHKEAFDFVFQCLPEPQSLLSGLRANIQAIEGIIIDSNNSNLFRFFPQIWEGRLANIKGDPAKWSRTGRGILFEAKIYPGNAGRVNIALIIGPGDPEKRLGVYQAAAAQPALFTGLVKPMGAQFATIFSRDLLTPSQARGLTFDQQANNVSLAWSDFQGQTLMPLINAVLAIDEQLTATN